MFGVDILGDRLFAINKDTAEVSPIGSLGFNANGAVGFDFDDATGTLYLTSIDDNAGTGNLYTINTTTGEANIVGQLIHGNQHTALAIASGAPCVPPTEVPWISLSPASGNIPPNDSEEVTVHMDASELTVGTHHANVCVGSNDPVRPLVGSASYSDCNWRRHSYSDIRPATATATPTGDAELTPSATHAVRDRLQGLVAHRSRRP